MGKISRQSPYLQMANIYNNRITPNSKNLGGQKRKVYKIHPSNAQQNVSSSKLVITSARSHKNDTSSDRSNRGNWSERDSTKLRLKSRGGYDLSGNLDFTTPASNKYSLFNQKYESLSSSNLNLKKNYHQDNSYLQ